MPNTALITGASRGLGGALAAFLAAQDHDLVLTARGKPELDATAAAVRLYGGRVVALAGDVTDPRHRDHLAEAAAALGRLDVVINNASDLGTTPLPHLADYPLDALRAVIEANVIAPLALVQTVLPLLQQDGGGLIVNISSDAATGGYPGWGGYGASKAALDLMSATLANELADRVVAVVAVDPGDMRTAMQQAACPDEDISDRPLPTATIPFFAWLFGQDRRSVSGRRYRAQGEQWEIAA